MSKLVNLTKARKARARAAEGLQAAENRARHGRTKPQRALEAAEAVRTAARLDGCKREPDS